MIACGLWRPLFASLALLIPCSLRAQIPTRIQPGTQSIPPLPPAPNKQDQKPPPEAIKAAALFEKAAKLQRAGRSQEAIAVYIELVKLAPGAYPAFMNLGILYQAQGNLTLAEASYKTAAHLDAKNPTPQIGRASCRERV